VSSGCATGESEAGEAPRKRGVESLRRDVRREEPFFPFFRDAGSFLPAGEAGGHGRRRFREERKGRRGGMPPAGEGIRDVPGCLIEFAGV